VAAMQRDHIAGGWWTMPGEPQGAWPGTKNGRNHRVWLSEAAAGLVEMHFASKRGKALDAPMKALVTALGLPRATPHDLRRTCLTAITRLGFGRDAMDRIANHRKGGVTDVYDRHGYGDEDRRIMEAVAAHLVGIAEGTGAPDNVVKLRQ
jgi:integrase